VSPNDRCNLVNVEMLADSVPDKSSRFATNSAGGVVLFEKSDCIIEPQKLDEGPRVPPGISYSSTHRLEARTPRRRLYPKDPPPERHEFHCFREMAFTNHKMLDSAPTKDPTTHLSH
jgi:hypothetical protein